MKASLFAAPVSVFTLNLLVLSGCGPDEPNSAWSEGASTQEELGTSKAALEDGSWVKIVPAHSSKCLDVENASMNNGARVQQWDCWNGANQWFRAQMHSYNSWSFVAGHSGKCLQVEGSANWNGANLQQSDCTGGPSQLFRLEYVIGVQYRMRPETSSRCLDVSNYSWSNGAQVVLWECNIGNNQLFSFFK